MAESLTFTRVAGDEGPPFTVTDNGFETTGWAITLRATKEGGAQYTLAAVIDDVGDVGAGTPAQYHFDFGVGDLEKGDQKFDLHFVNPSSDDFSIPDDFKMTLRVRAA